jgi:antirestriction protein ArdC
MESIREQITRRILTAMEAGVPPWRKGWEVSGTQVNATTGKPYAGVNQVLLAMTAASLPEGGDPRWLTLKQANASGKRVRKGEHSTKIVRMVEVAKNKPEGEASSRTEVLGEEDERRLVLKVYDVFHASQIDGMEPMAPRSNKVIEAGSAVDALSEGMRQTGLVILHGAQGASYLPRIDTIRMPDKATFHTSMDYANTLLHEMSHASGHTSRLARLAPSGQFTDQERAREELRAELASAMLGGELGLPMSQQQIDSHAAYLSSWHDLLANDPNEIFRAAADAQRMADYLRQVALKPEVDAQQKNETPQQPEVLPSAAKPRV